MNKFEMRIKLTNIIDKYDSFSNGRDENIDFWLNEYIDLFGNDEWMVRLADKHYWSIER